MGKGMNWRQLHETDGLRTFVVIFDKGDEPHSMLTEVTSDQGVSAASFTAGASD